MSAHDKLCDREGYKKRRDAKNVPVVVAKKVAKKKISKLKVIKGDRE